MTNLAQSVNCDPIMLLAGVLPVASAFLGPAVRISPSPFHETWKVPLLVHTVVLAYSGAGKSNAFRVLEEAMKAAMAVIRELQRQKNDRAPLLPDLRIAAKNLPSLLQQLKQRPDFTVLAFAEEIGTILDGLPNLNAAQTASSEHASRAQVPNLLDGTRVAFGTKSDGVDQALDFTHYPTGGYTQPDIFLRKYMAPGNNDDGVFNRHIGFNIAGQSGVEGLKTILVTDAERRNMAYTMATAELERSLSTRGASGCEWVSDSQSVPPSQPSQPIDGEASWSRPTEPIVSEALLMLVQLFVDCFLFGHRIGDDGQICLVKGKDMYLGTAGDVEKARARPEEDKLREPASGYEVFEVEHDSKQVLVNVLQSNNLGRVIGSFSKSKEMVMKVGDLTYILNSFIRHPNHREDFGASKAKGPRMVVPKNYTECAVAPCAKYAFPDLTCVNSLYNLEQNPSSATPMETLAAQIEDGSQITDDDKEMLDANRKAANAPPQSQSLSDDALLIRKMFLHASWKAANRDSVTFTANSLREKKVLRSKTNADLIVRLLELVYMGDERLGVPRLLKAVTKTGVKVTCEKILPRQDEAGSLAAVSASLSKLNMLLTDWVPSPLLASFVPSETTALGRLAEVASAASDPGGSPLCTSDGDTATAADGASNE
ncbi:hypothetical protein GPECTOR_411g254 [Gonium pectorale]|uniref:Uncharacterized protein n=1 Tax=Gonium pectorale TaxID=33097 RepID=A0A150FWW3_GONPE|nr:hypothetical protein GPECTOR_411g254 [Gonium pectorale]|eukprot:KXZ41530.1 hypothetical protein GPECTOR_411g254 [Gonium pectorale]